MITTLVADPPWQYGDKLTMSNVPRGAETNYTTMPTRDIAGMASYPNVAGQRIAYDAFLWLWVTNPFLLSGDGAHVCRAWGFEPKQLITWVKGRIDTGLVPLLVLRTGMGHYTRGCTEHMILGTRGQPKSLILNRGQNNLIVAEEETVFVAPLGMHSEKPERAYQLIERVTPGPYFEMFARKRRDGWLQHGNELR